MNPPPQELVEWAGLLANAATFLGIPIAIFVFLRERRRERKERELSTYSQLTGSYGEHLRLCMEHVGISAVECDAATDSVSEAERGQELLLQMVVNMLEAAYFLYRDQGSAFRRAQWTGWNDYIRDWCRHPEFRKRWPGLIQQYDSAFVSHVTTLFDEVRDLDRGSASP